MGFGCPICSERLEKLPAEAQARGSCSRNKEINISATPCGHIFHSYCIQKWLSGSMPSNKQCPCCRKDVPRLRCLPLYPTSYDESILDDSLSQAVSSPAPCNHGETITNLRNKVNKLEGDVREKDQMYDLLSGDYTTVMQKFKTEKLTSDTWMMRAKQYESYKDLANEMETRAKRAEDQLKTYSYVDSMIKGVETSVNIDLHHFPPNENSIRSLLEVKTVLSKELQSANAKFNELRATYDNLRIEKMKLKSQLEKKTNEYKELKQIYEISRVNGKVRSTSPVMAGPSNAVNSTATPTAFRTKRRLHEPVPSTATNPASTSAGVDEDIDVFPSAPSFKKTKKAVSTMKARGMRLKPISESSRSSIMIRKPSQPKALPKFIVPVSPIGTIGSQLMDGGIKTQTSPSEKETLPKLNLTINLSSDSDDDDFRIRGNVPGAPLLMKASRIENLERKSQNPVLGVTSKAKKFNFSKKPPQ